MISVGGSGTLLASPVLCIHIHTLQLSPHNGTQSPMQQAQRACPHLRSLPYPVSRGDRLRRVGGILASQPAKALGFLAPLLPTPLGPTLSGERPIALSVPSECCAGAVGDRPTALAVGVTGKLFLEVAVWSRDKTWNSICWPRSWAISKWAAGQVGLFLVLLRPRNPRIMLRYVGPHKVGAKSESQSNLYQD